MSKSRIVVSWVQRVRKITSEYVKKMKKSTRIINYRLGLMNSDGDITQITSTVLLPWS